MHKTKDEGWNPYSLFILVLSTPLCVLKTTHEVWDSYRLLSLVLKSLFCMKRTTDEGWNLYRLVILMQITLVCMHKATGYIWDSNTFYSCPKFAVLHPKTTPHLLFLHAKLRLLDQNNKSLWVPDMTCHFVHVQQRA